MKPIGNEGRPAGHSHSGSQGAALTLERFEPEHGAALRLIEQLLGRGGALIAVHRDRVSIRRESLVAEIDATGRVSWRSARWIERDKDREQD